MKLEKLLFGFIYILCIFCLAYASFQMEGGMSALVTLGMGFVVYVLVSARAAEKINTKVEHTTRKLLILFNVSAILLKGLGGGLFLAWEVWGALNPDIIPFLIFLNLSLDYSFLIVNIAGLLILNFHYRYLILKTAILSLLKHL